MTGVFVAALIVMVAVFVVGMTVIAKKLTAEQVGVQQFQASLAKDLPPDVQADMKPRQLGLVTSVAIAVVVLSIFVAGLTTTAKPTDVVFYVFGLVAVTVFASWTAVNARTWLDRRNPGEVLVDLSPYPLAGAVRRSSWLMCVAIVPVVFVCISKVFTGDPRAGDGLFLAAFAALLLLSLLTSLMYSDRVWLAEHGLYFGGRLYPWGGFERIAWTDDGRAFALEGGDGGCNGAG